MAVTWYDLTCTKLKKSAPTSNDETYVFNFCYPNIPGQGANCALETAAVFCETVRDLSDSSSSVLSSASKWSWAIVAEFNQRRHADVLAAVDLTYGGIGARRSRGRENAPLSYKVQVAGMMILHKLTLGVVPMPALLRIMSGDTVPYSKLRMFHFYYEKIICIAGLAIVAVPILWCKRKTATGA